MYAQNTFCHGLKRKSRGCVARARKQWLQLWAARCVCKAVEYSPWGVRWEDRSRPNIASNASTDFYAIGRSRSTQSMRRGVTDSDHMVTASSYWPIGPVRLITVYERYAKEPWFLVSNRDEETATPLRIFTRGARG